MGNRKTPFVVGEWYHCYSRGIDKNPTFLEEADYWRLLESAHIANRKTCFPRNKLESLSSRGVWKLTTTEPLVAIGAYCLMPNHFHLLMKEIVDGGISMFMQRLGTAYAMYFNKKNSRSGAIFTSPFRSKHIADDLYLKQVLEYIHLNPLDLLLDEVSNKESCDHLKTYTFSSLLDHTTNKKRLQSRLLNLSELPFKVEPSWKVPP